VQALPKEAFVRAAWSVVGRKVNKQAKLEELYELAQRSIALPVAVDSVAIETFRLQLAQLRRLAELRQTLEARAHALLKDRADFQRLCSLPGVAAILALVILAEGGDIECGESQPRAGADSVFTMGSGVFLRRGRLLSRLCPSRATTGPQTRHRARSVPPSRGVAPAHLRQTGEAGERVVSPP